MSGVTGRILDKQIKTTSNEYILRESLKNTSLNVELHKYLPPVQFLKKESGSRYLFLLT